MRLTVKVTPGASRNAVRGWLGDALKVAVTAAPEKGRANQAVEELLAETLNLPRSAVRVVAGHTQSRKRVEVTGLTREELEKQIGVPEGLSF